MLRWLLIILFIYIVYKLIQGPKRSRRSTIRFRFGDFNNQANQQKNRQSSRRQQLDDIEDAEFEDITDKVKEEDNS